MELCVKYLILMRTINCIVFNFFSCIVLAFCLSSSFLHCLINVNYVCDRKPYQNLSHFIFFLLRRTDEGVVDWNIRWIYILIFFMLFLITNRYHLQHYRIVSGAIFSLSNPIWLLCNIQQLQLIARIIIKLFS